jgi:endonuclease YncB( thermonuclease family)
MISKACVVACAPLVLLFTQGQSAQTHQTQSGGAAASEADPLERATHEVVELVRIESADTYHVRRKDAVERVHLLAVDTEEPIAGRDASDMTKPQTPFGDASVAWVNDLFHGLADEDGTTRFGLHYPTGELKRDVYGRILCHVILPGGEDLNLRLVREGLSPYYNKYGNSLVCHDEFISAQTAARAAKVGIWDPETNASPGGRRGAEVEKRPYPELIAWWDARAAAIEDFRARSAAEPLAVVGAEDPLALLRSVEQADGKVEVFGEIARFDDEAGARDVLFRGVDRGRAMSILIPASAREAHRSLRLESRHGTFRQNFFYVSGTLERNGPGFRIVSEAPSQWRVAGPEPTLRD